MEKKRSGNKGNKRRKKDDNNPLDLARHQGVRLPKWAKQAEEGEHDDDQFEFMMAVEEFKSKNNKPFPTLSELLFILKTLGYRKVAESGN